MDRDIHDQGERTRPRNGQKLPSFAVFPSFSTPDETRTVAPAKRPSSTSAGSSALSVAGGSHLVRPHSWLCLHTLPVLEKQSLVHLRERRANPIYFRKTGYTKIPSLSTAEDRCTYMIWDWFPETRRTGTSNSADRSLASTSLFSLDPNSSKLRPALLGSQAEQNGQPRRTSLPSISSLTLQERNDSEHYQHLYYHTSNTFARNYLLTRHSSQGSTVSPVKHNLKLLSVHVSASTWSHILPTGPRSLPIYNP